MFPWRNALPPAETAATYAVGDIVRSESCSGTVVSVAESTMEVVWSDGDSPITYPIEAPYLRKAMPWE